MWKISLFSSFKNKRNEKINETEDASFYQIITKPFRVNRTLESSSWDKSDDVQNSNRRFKYNLCGNSV